MPIPPSFSDLGKGAKDLFDKNFNFGLVKAEIKSKTTSGVELKTDGNHNIETGRVAGNLETKYKFADYGITFTEKWSTNNVVTSELSMEDKLIKGFKQTFEAALEPNTGKKSAKVKNAYKRDYVNMNCDFDFHSSVPQLQAASVFGHKGYLAGIQVGFDCGKQSLTKLNYAFGYSASDFTFHGAVTNGSDYQASFYQKLSDKVEGAVNLSWAASTHATKFGAVAKYNTDKSSFVKLKVDNSSLIGLAYCFQARDGVKVTMAGQIDGKSINAGGHKLGLALEFEP